MVVFAFAVAVAGAVSTELLVCGLTLFSPSVRFSIWFTLSASFSPFMIFDSSFGFGLSPRFSFSVAIFMFSSFSVVGVANSCESPFAKR